MEVSNRVAEQCVLRPVPQRHVCLQMDEGLVALAVGEPGESVLMPGSRLVRLDGCERWETVHLHSGGGAVPQWEAASRMSACGARGGAGDRPDVGEHAAGVPGWEGSYEQRGAVELDAVLAGGLGPGELAGVPFDEGFGFRRDVEVLVEAGVRLADLGVSALDE